MNAVVFPAETQDVVSPYAAAVVSRLQIRLKCLLGREIVGASAIGTTPAQHAASGYGCSDIDAESRDWIIDACGDAAGTIHDSITESEIGETKAVVVIAFRKVVAHGARRSVVLVFERLNRTGGAIRPRLVILIEIKAQEHVTVLRGVPIQSAVGREFSKWLRESRIQPIEWRTEWLRGSKILHGSLAGKKPEEFVFDDGTTHPPAKLLALKSRSDQAGKVRGNLITTKQSETFSVQSIAAGTRREIDLSR